MPDHTPLQYRVSRRSFLKSIGAVFANTSAGGAVLKNPLIEAALGISDTAIHAEELVSVSEVLRDLLNTKTDFIRANGALPEQELTSKVNLAMKALRRIYDYLGQTDEALVKQELTNYDSLATNFLKTAFTSIAESVVNQAQASPPETLEAARKFLADSANPENRNANGMRHDIVMLSHNLIKANPSFEAVIENAEEGMKSRFADEAVARGFSREKLDDIKFIQNVFTEWKTGLKPLNIYSLFTQGEEGFTRFASTIINHELSNFAMTDLKGDFSMLFKPESRILEGDYLNIVHTRMAQFLHLPDAGELKKFRHEPSREELEEGRKLQERTDQILRKKMEERIMGTWEQRIHDARGNDPSAVEAPHPSTSWRGDYY